MIEKILKELTDAIRLLTVEIKRMNGEIPERIYKDLYFQTIYDLDISAKAANILRDSGFEFVGDIVCNKRMDNDFKGLLKVPNMGKQSYQVIYNALKKHGVLNPIVDETYWIERSVKTGEAPSFFH